MFTYADQDRDGRISYTEFQTMINPPKPPEPPKPSLADLTMARTVAAARSRQGQPSTLSVRTSSQTA